MTAVTATATNMVWKRPNLSEMAPRPKRPVPLAMAKMPTMSAPVAASMPAWTCPTSDTVDSITQPVQATVPKNSSRVQKNGVFSIWPDV